MSVWSFYAVSFYYKRATWKHHGVDGGPWEKMEYKRRNSRGKYIENDFINKKDYTFYTL